MNDYLKLQIKNPNTDKSLWFDYPFNIDNIKNTLHLSSSNYEIVNYKSSAPIIEYNIYDTIDEIVEDYNKYLSLPTHIQKNITAILDVVSDIDYVYNAVKENTIAFYENCETNDDLAKEMLKQRGDVPNDIINCIDTEKYFKNTYIEDSILIDTHDGIFEITY